MLKSMKKLLLTSIDKKIGYNWDELDVYFFGYVKQVGLLNTKDCCGLQFDSNEVRLW